ncbi:hypothetical protein Pelo_15252 [Pelomyxa schiedti]|nr:hypothetical protein Pelo_15252 [Pelomyxa schiedti]
MKNSASGTRQQNRKHNKKGKLLHVQQQPKEEPTVDPEEQAVTVRDDDDAVDPAATIPQSHPGSSGGASAGSHPPATSTSTTTATATTTTTSITCGNAENLTPPPIPAASDSTNPSDSKTVDGGISVNSSDTTTPTMEKISIHGSGENVVGTAVRVMGGSSPLRGGTPLHKSSKHGLLRASFHCAEVPTGPKSLYHTLMRALGPTEGLVDSTGLQAEFITDTMARQLQSAKKMLDLLAESDPEFLKNELMLELQISPVLAEKVTSVILGFNRDRALQKTTRWLQKNRLPYLVQPFKEHEILYSQLPKLTQADLLAMDIKVGPIKEFLKAAADVSEYPVCVDSKKSRVVKITRLKFETRGLSEEENTFSATVSMVMKWDFDVTKETSLPQLEVEVDIRSIWLPQLKFSNAVGDVSFLYQKAKLKCISKPGKPTKYQVLYHVIFEGTFLEIFELVRFPLDRQLLHVRLENEASTSNERVFFYVKSPKELVESQKHPVKTSFLHYLNPFNLCHGQSPKEKDGTKLKVFVPPSPAPAGANGVLYGSMKSLHTDWAPYDYSWVKVSSNDKSFVDFSWANETEKEDNDSCRSSKEVMEAAKESTGVGEKLAEAELLKRAYSHVHLVGAVDRRPKYYFWNCIIPLFLVVCAAFTTYCCDPLEIGNRLQVACGIVATVVFFKFSVGAVVCKTQYLTWLDHYFLTSFLLLSAIIGGLVVSWAVESELLQLPAHFPQSGSEVDSLAGSCLLLFWVGLHVIILPTSLFFKEAWNDLENTQEKTVTQERFTNKRRSSLLGPSALLLLSAFLMLVLVKPMLHHLRYSYPNIFPSP